MSSNTLTRFFGIVLFASTFWIPVSRAQTQEASGWKLVNVPVTKTIEVPVPRLVEETKMETETVVTKKPVWQVEKRARKVTTLKPVVKERERIVRETLYQPKTVTRYRDRTIEETTYREVTDYRDEKVVVRKPVVETRVREQQVTVKKPVTETLIEVQRTQMLKPVTETKTDYLLEPGEVQLATFTDPNARPRLRFLRPGYYTDPTTGMSVYRRPGFHWAQPTASVPVAATPPSLVPQTRTETRYVPETVITKRPVEMTRMVEETRTERVPYEVEKMVESVETRRVPYTRTEPVTTYKTTQVPYTETIYEEKEVVRRVPYTETVMEEVVEYEPYEVEVERWVPVERQVERPKKVTVEKVEMVERKVTVPTWMKVRVDAEGNEIGDPVELTEADRLFYGIPEQRGEAADQSPSMDRAERNNPPRSFVAKPLTRSTEVVPETQTRQSRQTALKPVANSNPNGRSVLDNFETPPVESPEAKIPVAPRPNAADSSETGNENAGD